MRGKRVLALALGAAMALTAACGREKTAEPVTPLVKYERVGTRGADAFSTYAASVRGRYETALAFQVSGKIASRTVNLGDRVRAGDVLMTLDPKDVAQQARSSDAQVAAAETNLALARSNLARYTELYKADAIAAAVLDQYQTAYDAAAASYENALAQAAQAKNALSYTQLTANADGVIAAVSAEAGQVVGAGTPVMTLVQTNELEAEFSVPENQRRTVAEGLAAEVSFWALGDFWTPGVVREVAPMADSASRTYKVRVALPNPPAGLEPGMTASVRLQELPTGADGAGLSRQTAGYWLPLAALYQTGDMPQVWIVGEDNRLHLQNVTVEGYSGDKVMITGVSAGDLVVTAGVHKLYEGQTVRLGEEEARP